MHTKICLAYIILVVLFVPSQLISQPPTIQEQSQQKEIEKNSMLLRSAKIEEKVAASEYLKKLTREELGSTNLATARKLFLNEAKAVRQFREFAMKPGITINDIPEELRYVNGEQWKMYFLNLCDIVAKAADVEVLPQLIEFKASPREMTGYGEAAIDALIRLLNEPIANVKYPNTSRQTYAIQVLTEYMKKKEIGNLANADIRKKISGALIDTVISGKDHSLRIFIIKSLGDLGDEAFIPVLEEVAQNDKYGYETRSNPKIEKDMPEGQPVVRYPVRKHAQEALEKIKQKRK